MTEGRRQKAEGSPKGLAPLRSASGQKDILVGDSDLSLNVEHQIKDFDGSLKIKNNKQENFINLLHVKPSKAKLYKFKAFTLFTFPVYSTICLQKPSAFCPLPSAFIQTL